MLDCKFGKDNLRQCFTADAQFRHILVFLFKSGFLSPEDEATLSSTTQLATALDHIIRDHRTVDFTPLRAHDPDWATATTIPPETVRL